MSDSVPTSTAAERAGESAAERRPTGRLALTLVAIANGMSLVITIGLIALLLSVPPTGGGDYFLGVLKIPRGTDLMFVVGFALQFVLAAIGIWGLVLGIVAIAKNSGRKLGALAVTIAVLVPLFSLSAFWIITGSRLVVA